MSRRGELCEDINSDLARTDGPLIVLTAQSDDVRSSHVSLALFFEEQFLYTLDFGNCVEIFVLRITTKHVL